MASIGSMPVLSVSMVAGVTIPGPFANTAGTIFTPFGTYWYLAPISEEAFAHFYNASDFGVSNPSLQLQINVVNARTKKFTRYQIHGIFNSQIALNQYSVYATAIVSMGGPNFVVVDHSGAVFFIQCPDLQLNNSVPIILESNTTQLSACGGNVAAFYDPTPRPQDGAPNGVVLIENIVGFGQASNYYSAVYPVNQFGAGPALQYGFQANVANGQPDPVNRTGLGTSFRHPNGGYWNTDAAWDLTFGRAAVSYTRNAVGNCLNPCSAVPYTCGGNQYPAAWGAGQSYAYLAANQLVNRSLIAQSITTDWGVNGLGADQNIPVSLSAFWRGWGSTIIYNWYPDKGHNQAVYMTNGVATLLIGTNLYIGGGQAYAMGVSSKYIVGIYKNSNQYYMQALPALPALATPARGKVLSQLINYARPISLTGAYKA